MISQLLNVGSVSAIIVAVERITVRVSRFMLTHPRTKGITMTSPTGAELMGIVKPVETAVEPAVPAVETAVMAAEEAIKTPDTETIETAVADAVPAVKEAVKVAPGAAQALRNAAHELVKLAESFE